MIIFKKIVKSLLSQPVIIIVYWLFCYELALLCQYGRYGNTVAILLGCVILIVVMFIVCMIQTLKRCETRFLKIFHTKKWLYLSISIYVMISGFYGIKIVKSATNYGGKLAWMIERIKNEREIEFSSNQLFEFGVAGIFKDINDEIPLPEKLYVSDDFYLEFNANGQIIAFNTYVYGKNAQSEDDSYLISYDQKRNEKIIVRLNGYVQATYQDDKLLAPLIETVQGIDFQELVKTWHEEVYGIYYEGNRRWPSTTEGMTILLESGQEEPILTTMNEYVGYTVSVFVPKKEDVITPMRYHLLRYFGGARPESEEIITPDTKNISFFLSDEVGYELMVVDQALGSTFYALTQTIDGGASWHVINENPFSGAVGGVSGITFLNNQLGFLSSSRSGGNYGELYRTSDGGFSYDLINIEPYDVVLDNGATISPFDCQMIPYEEKGGLYLLVGQGSDGDYLGNSQALYESKDEGKTWEFVKVVE